MPLPPGMAPPPLPPAPAVCGVWGAGVLDVFWLLLSPPPEQPASAAASTIDPDTAHSLFIFMVFCIFVTSKGSKPN